MEHFIPTQISGRLLHGLSTGQQPCPPSTLVIAFHGYAESADEQMKRLEMLDLEGVVLACPQALHPFYNKFGDVGYSWMTKNHREQTIAENLAYLDRCIEQLQKSFAFERIICMGFSQGVAMALRFGLRQSRTYAIACLGGDLPSDCLELLNTSKPKILWGRGIHDRLVGEERWAEAIPHFQFHQIDFLRLDLEGNHFCWNNPIWIRSCQQICAAGANHQDSEHISA